MNLWTIHAAVIRVLVCYGLYSNLPRPLEIRICGDCHFEIRSVGQFGLLRSVCSSSDS
jgi:hypothetical protein